MARRDMHRLTAQRVLALNTPGRHADGANLYLRIDHDGSRRWIFLFADRANGRPREMGLGPAPGRDKAGMSLHDARRKAAECRRMLHNGDNPLDAKRRAGVTFGSFAEDLVEQIGTGFRNAKHRAQWKSSLQTHAASLWPLSIDAITTEDVLAALSPIWTEKHETASRVRGRIERVLDAARAKGLRTGENPARWKGHLKELLAKRKTLTRGHHGAVAYNDMPDFMRDLRARKSMSAVALEFTILCATRTGETLGAKWSEIDLKGRTWIIPGKRTKSGREHRVPLTDRAVELLRGMILPDVEPGGYVFVGQNLTDPLSNMAMLQLLRDMRGMGMTTHGFRSTFRDWAAETTPHESIVCEMALAHVVGNKAEAAYRRGDLFEKRRGLMDDWARFLSGEIGKVVSITRKRRAKP
jgi:integrase